MTPGALRLQEQQSSLEGKLVDTRVGLQPPRKKIYSVNLLFFTGPLRSFAELARSPGVRPTCQASQRETAILPDAGVGMSAHESLARVAGAAISIARHVPAISPINPERSTSASVGDWNVFRLGPLFPIRSTGAPNEHR
jgi:hypothetical protein